MSDSFASELKRHCGSLFASRTNLDCLWQEIADNFYPERADFTATRTIGEDFAANLSTSYPVIVRRELGNTVAAMLRPKGTNWFSIRVADYETLDTEGKRWLEWATGVMNRAIYDKKAQFTRATKEGDNDFVTFGQAVISQEIDMDSNNLLYRCWHLRDVVWSESEKGSIDTIYRKWSPTVQELVRLYGADKLSSSTREKIGKDSGCKIPCIHAVIPYDVYQNIGGTQKYKTKYVSIYMEQTDGHIISEEASPSRIYVIPRWQTVSGSQYAFSPCTVAGLPDARMIQSMALSLIEAGEKISNPPILMTEGAIRSDVNLFAGGVTRIDREYDEQLGEALKPLRLDVGGLPAGVEMQDKVKEALFTAFYLNKISLPPVVGEVTAYEISQRVQEYVRQALPLFEPMEAEYNGELCEETFNSLMRVGAFGAVSSMPASLRGKEVAFTFESPLRDATEKQKGQIFLQSKAMVAEGAALDPSAVSMLRVPEALRDVLHGIGASANWITSKAEMEAIKVQQQEQQAQQQQLALMQQGATVAETAGRAAQSFKDVV